MNLLAYHVSRVSGVGTLHPSICDDKSRDDQLCGASVVCFTTTLRDGKLPKTSTYPRSVTEGTMVYRYFMEFNPKNFFIFLMAKTTLNRVDQVHFLLLKRDAGWEEQIAKFLRKQQLYRRETKRETSVYGFVVLRSVKKVQVTTEGSKRAWKRYFPDGKPNDFCSDTRSGGRAFVNVMFWHKVQVQHLDEVEKQGYKFPPSEGNIGKSPWLEKLLERYSNERMRYDRQKDEAKVRMLWIGRNELQRERSEFETEKSIFEEEKAEFEEMAKKKKELANEKKAFEKVKKQAFNKEKAELLKMVEKLKTERPNKETKLNVETLKRDKKAPERKTSKVKKSTDGPPENDTATQSHDENKMVHTKGFEKKKKKQGHEAKGFSGNSDKKHTRKQEKEKKKASLENHEIGGHGDENAINKKTKKPEVLEKKKKKATKLGKEDFRSEDKP